VALGGGGDDELGCEGSTRDRGPDDLRGGPGADTLFARDAQGNDRLNGGGDVGPTFDTCTADTTDEFVNCEVVDA
jgi:hypothetical protein